MLLWSFPCWFSLAGRMHISACESRCTGIWRQDGVTKVPTMSHHPLVSKNMAETPNEVHKKHWGMRTPSSSLGESDVLQKPWLVGWGVVLSTYIMEHGVEGNPTANLGFVAGYPQWHRMGGLGTQVNESRGIPYTEEVGTLSGLCSWGVIGEVSVPCSSVFHLWSFLSGEGALEGRGLMNVFCVKLEMERKIAGKSFANQALMHK